MISRFTKTIKLLNKTERNVYETLTISLFAISFLSVFALRPSIKVIAAYRKRLSEATQASQLLTTKINNLNKAGQNIIKYQSEIAKIRESLPTDFKQSNLLKSLSFLAAGNGITILKTEFETTKKEGLVELVKTVKISMDIKGPLENIYSFLQKMEQEPRYIRVNSVIIQTNKDVTTSRISAEVFYISAKGK